MCVKRYWGISLVVLLVCSSAAMGSWLPLDGNVLTSGTTTWQGTVPFTYTLGSHNLNVNVDYAVYAPGQFGTSMELGYPTDPSDGTEYVYAYQIWNNTGGNQGVSAFTVGFTAAPGNSDPANQGFVLAPSNSGVPPASYDFSYGSSGDAQSAVWSYGSATPLAIGKYSDILIYTSPYPPEWDQSSVQTASALVAGGFLPSPVPEPATCTLLIVAGIFLAVRRRMRA